MAISYEHTARMQIGGDTLDVVEQDDGRRFVMVPLEDYPGMRETAHLLASRANADELDESIAWLNKAAGSAPFDAPEGANQQISEALSTTISADDARIMETILDFAAAAMAAEKLSREDFKSLLIKVREAFYPRLRGELYQQLFRDDRNGILAEAIETRRMLMEEETTNRLYDTLHGIPK